MSPTQLRPHISAHGTRRHHTLADVDHRESTSAADPRTVLRGRLSSIQTSSDFLQRVSIACYAEGCISYSKSVRPSVRPYVCHTLALCQNDSSCDHAVFTGGWAHDSSFLMVNFSAKFQREPGGESAE